jgi:hypothetical protein
VRECGRIRLADAVRHHNELATLQSLTHAIGVGQADDGIRRHDPDGLDAPIEDGVEHVDSLVARAARNDRTVPERLHRFLMHRIPGIHVRGEHVRHAAGLAATHRVRLARDGERPHSRPADAPGEQVAVDDAVDLVRAGRGLIHAHRERGDHALGASEELVELAQEGVADFTRRGYRGQVASLLLRDGDR